MKNMKRVGVLYRQLFVALFLSVLWVAEAFSAAHTDTSAQVKKDEQIMMLDKVISSSSQCHAFVEKEELSVLFDFVMPVAGSQERNENLYVYSLPLPLSDWNVVDINTLDRALPNTLQLPLHTLKYKTYLNHKPLLIVGNGVNYAELEAEVTTLTQYFRHPVKILMGGKRAWQTSTSKDNLPLMKPEQFVREADLGNWGYIYTKNELNSLVEQAPYFFAMDRFLLMDPAIVKNVDIPEQLLYSLFVLDGGMTALEDFAVNQGRILSRIQRREREQRCQFNEYN